MISAAELVVAGLATWQIVEIWHHSSLFAGVRARVELMDVEGARGRLRELLSCPFCLSVWVGGLVALVTALPLPAVGWEQAGWGVGGFFVGLVLVFGVLWVLGVMMMITEYRQKKRMWYTWVYEVAVYAAGVAALTGAAWGAWEVTPPGTVEGMWFLGLGAAKVTVLGFALSRLANLGNDLTRHWCRTPRLNKLDHLGDGDDTSPTAEEKQDVGPPPAAIPGPGHWGGTPGGTPPV